MSILFIELYMPERPENSQVFNDEGAFHQYLRQYFHDMWEEQGKSDQAIADELVQLQTLLLESIAGELEVEPNLVSIDYSNGIQASPSGDNVALKNLPIRLVVNTGSNRYEMYVGINIGTAENMYDHDNHQIRENIGDSYPRLTINAVNIID